MPALVRIGGPLSKLLRDVGGRGYAGSGDRKLAPLGEDPIRDGQLAPCGTRGNGQLASLGLKAGEPFLRPGFVAVDPRQLVLAEAALQFLRPSIGIAAGLNPKTLSTYLGHATITITLDRYGHLMPGSEVEARALLDAYLSRPRQ